MADTSIGLQVMPELLGASYGSVLKGLLKPLPSGDFDIEAVVDKQGVNWPFIACGISLGESSIGRYHSLHIGSVYYSDPWNGNLTRDVAGLLQFFWSNANIIADGVGLPLPVMRLHQRITRVGNTITRLFRHTADGPWINLWGSHAVCP